MKRYFTITTLNHSGLGDQLGTQFSRLYAMGIADGREYIYTPMYFSRSVKPLWYMKRSNLFFGIRKFVFSLFGQSLFSSALNAVLLKAEGKMDRILYDQKDNFAEFLGLRHLQKTNDVPTEHDDVINLSWNGDMWKKIPEIDAEIESKGVSVYEVWKTIFSTVFNDLHPKIQKGKKSVVMHMRLGDSTTIQLADTKLIVYDKYIFSSEEQMKEIFAIDRDRHSVKPEEYLTVFNKIKDDGNSYISIISDGYDLTYKNILRDLLKRKCQIRLSRKDRKELLNRISHRNDVFGQFAGSKLVIGETLDKLCESVESLAHADCVIWGCGGFAVNMHNMFRPIGDRSYITNVKDFEIDKYKSLWN